MKFADIIGHEGIKRMLVKGVDENRVSHAQLFSGQCGWQTLPMAVAYAQYINCTDRRDGDSCGECPSCRKIAALVHPDVNYVFPIVTPKNWKSDTKPTSDYYLPQWRELALGNGFCFDEQMWYRQMKVENQQGLITTADADEIIRKLSFKSFEAEYKITIIWLPEKLHTTAANKLLKILEEPWEKTLFLLVSEMPQKLLTTIVSRTQQVEIPRIEEQRLAEYAGAELGLDLQKACHIARLSDGNLLKLKEIAASEQDGEKNEQFQQFVSLMRLCYSNKHLELFEWADTLASAGRESQKRFFIHSLALLREAYIKTAGMEEIGHLWGEEEAFMDKFAPYVNNQNIERLVMEMESAQQNIIQNGNAKIVLTHFALSVSKLIGRN